MLKYTALILILSLLTACGEMRCRENSKMTNYARSLPQERLTKLYYDMEAHSTKDNIPSTGYGKHNSDRDFPNEFADLEFALFRPNDASIMVDGCLDEFSYLHFDGFGESEEPKIIRLSYMTSPYD